MTRRGRRDRRKSIEAYVGTDDTRRPPPTWRRRIAPVRQVLDLDLVGCSPPRLTAVLATTRSGIATTTTADADHSNDNDFGIDGCPTPPAVHVARQDPAERQQDDGEYLAVDTPSCRPHDTATVTITVR